MSEEKWVPELDEIFNNIDDIKNILQRIEQKIDQKSAEKSQKKNIVYYKGNNEKVSIHRKNSESND